MRILDDMEEKRIDCSKQTPEELALAAHHAKFIHRFNMAEPYTEEWTNLMHEIFKGKIGEGSRVMITCKPVPIKKGAWIGAGSTFLSEVTIEKYAVVGTSSSVTKDIPDYTVAVGSPAKIIKYLDKEKFNNLGGVYKFALLDFRIQKMAKRHPTIIKPFDGVNFRTNL